MTPGEIVFLSQWACAISVLVVYLFRSFHGAGRGKMVDKKRLFEIVSAAASAAILPIGLVFVYVPVNPEALGWIDKGEYRIFFMIIGIGVIVFAATNLINNWRK